MKFIKIENNLINLDNVTAIFKFNEESIRICFIEERDYIDIEKESEEELNDLWERLRSLCMGEGEQKKGGENISIGFNWFKEYKIVYNKLDYCYDDYHIIYNGGNSTSHSAGNVIKTQNLIEKYSGKRIPLIYEECIDSIDYKFDLIEPTEMIEICNKILANTECDEVGMRNRIERFKELSENGYYLSYDCG